MVKKKLTKQLADQIEILDAVGQESEKKGIKAVQEVHKSDEIEQKKEYDDVLNRLDFSKGKRHQEYRRLILHEAQMQLANQEIPKGFYFMFSLTSKGLVLWIRYLGKWHANGMLISQSPLFDAQAIIRLIDNGLIYADVLREAKEAREEKKSKAIISHS